MKCMLPHVYILQCGDDYCKKKIIIIMEKNKNYSVFQYMGYQQIFLESTYIW